MDIDLPRRTLHTENRAIAILSTSRGLCNCFCDHRFTYGIRIFSIEILLVTSLFLIEIGEVLYSSIFFCFDSPDQLNLFCHKNPIEFTNLIRYARLKTPINVHAMMQSIQLASALFRIPNLRNLMVDMRVR